MVLIAQWRREMHVYSAFPYKQMVHILSKGNQTNVRTPNARSTQVTLVVRYASLNLCTWSSPLQPLHTPCQALPKLGIGLLVFREDFGALLVDSDKCPIQFGELIQRPLHVRRDGLSFIVVCERGDIAWASDAERIKIVPAESPYAGGFHPKSEPWRCGADSPLKDSNESLDIFALAVLAFTRIFPSIRPIDI